MGRAISKIKHPFRDFNVESRAAKVISQPKPKPAPLHAKDQLDLKRMKEEFPQEFEESKKKNETLDKHLKDVFVLSHDRPETVNPSRPLPQDRSASEPFLYGHKEPEHLPKGKTSLRLALEFISKHQGEPKIYTAARIADEYNLSEDDIKKVLEYYRVFQIYIPVTGPNSKATFAGPSPPKIHIVDPSKSLPANKFKKDADNT